MKQVPSSTTEPAVREQGSDEARRRAVLARLGKGSAALATMAPLVGIAGGTGFYKCANAKLPGGWGYSTFSGYHSAVVSAAGSTVGTACHPQHFCKINTATSSYKTFCGTSSNPTANQLANKINSYFNCGTWVTGTKINSTLYAAVPTSLVVTGYNLVIRPTSSSGGIALQGQNLPYGCNPLATFKSIFTTSGDARTLLEVLYDGIQSTTPGTARCYFASTYLTVYSGTPSTLPVGFNKSYVVSNYPGDANVGSSSDNYAFLKTLCVTT
jgi:hypothetical protein